MGYRVIVNSAIAAGKVTSQLLWRTVRGNFVSHEMRLSELEGSSTIVPPGTIFKYAGSSAPAGFLLCNGAAVGQLAYPDLYAIIGVSYGNPGGGQFNLPDLRGRVLVGRAGSGIISISPRAVGDTGGEEEHELDITELPTHAHAVVDPQHSHPGVLAAGSSSTLPYWHFSTTTQAPVTPTRTTIASVTNISLGYTGGGDSHNNMQPSLVVNFIVKT